MSFIVTIILKINLQINFIYNYSYPVTMLFLMQNIFHNALSLLKRDSYSTTSLNRESIVIDKGLEQS